MKATKKMQDALDVFRATCDAQITYCVEADESDRIGKGYYDFAEVVVGEWVFHVEHTGEVNVINEEKK